MPKAASPSARPVSPMRWASACTTNRCCAAWKSSSRKNSMPCARPVRRREARATTPELATVIAGCNHRPMNWSGFLAVGIGAALGAWLRWGLGHWLNAALPQLPLGTLAANLIGGYCIGLALAWFALTQGLSPEARLLIVTGFLGGLTTFSTFSAEAVSLLTSHRYGLAATHVALHVFGSLAATALGFATLRW